MVYSCRIHRDHWGFTDKWTPPTVAAVFHHFPPRDQSKGHLKTLDSRYLCQMEMQPLGLLHQKPVCLKVNTGYNGRSMMASQIVNCAMGPIVDSAAHEATKTKK